ncbi:hypothetical protein E3V55_04110 [Candidatus Marinimicrobia bacterium MT.SAG.3]|nr:hypothetical protein E3V55_04110 [Candidatus Marinimicrobia bacterium MT.SAG.3]
MNHKSIQITAGFIASIVLSVNVVLAQDDEIVYTRLFSSINIAQWEMSGFVTPDTSDDAVSFIFPFDENAAPHGAPDTVVLTIRDYIDLSRCSTAYVRYRKSSDRPNAESWLISDIYIYARHDLNHSWERVFENISNLAGEVKELELKFKIVVKTDKAYPSTLTLYDIRVEGTCSL